MALRSVENRYATPSIVAKPSKPVNRPMRSPLSFRFASVQLMPMKLSPENAAHQRPLFSRSFFANVITLRDEALCFGKFGVAIVMNRGQWFSLFHAIADPLVEFQADAVIDLVFLFLAASAEHGEHDAKLLAVHAGDEAAGGTRYVEMQARGGQTLRLVNDSFIAALQANPLPEFLERLTGGNHGFREAPAFFHVLCSFAAKKHPGGELQAQVTQIGEATALEDFDGLADFIRMSGHAAKRLIHVGDEGHHFLAHALAGF